LVLKNEVSWGCGNKNQNESHVRRGEKGVDVDVSGTSVELEWPPE